MSATIIFDEYINYNKVYNWENKYNDIINLVSSIKKNHLKAIKKKTLSSKNMVCIGRSHGIHAQPTTMGLKFHGEKSPFMVKKFKN